MKRGATRLKEFDYSARSREKPALGNGAYAKLWNIVDGGVRDALKAHPDYLTPKGQHSARTSIVKRVTGTVIGFAEQSAKGRSDPAETDVLPRLAEHPAAVTTADAGAGAVLASPIDPHCRIGKVRFKTRTRYRSPSAFDLTTAKLRRVVERDRSTQATLTLGSARGNIVLGTSAPSPIGNHCQRLQRQPHDPRHYPQRERGDERHSPRVAAPGPDHDRDCRDPSR